MKVALAGAFPPQQKGEASYLGSYALALRSQLGDQAITILSQYGRVPCADEWNGFSVRRIVRDRTERPSYRPQRELVDAVAASDADVVHLHYGPNQDYGGRIGEPLVGALRSIRRRGIKTVLTLHSLWMPRDVADSAPAQRLPPIARPLAIGYFGRFLRVLRAQCDAFLCLVSAQNSAMTFEFGQAYGLQDLGEEIHGCSIDFTPMPSGEPLILSFGFLRAEKGFEVLIEGFKKYVQRGGAGTLVIAGRPLSKEDERYAVHLATLAAPYPHRIRFQKTYISDAELEKYLAAASIVALPYLRNVGASGPLHLALGVGRPVIATAVGHNRCLADGVTLVEPGSSEAIAAELFRLLHAPNELMAAAQKARDAAQRRNWNSLAAHNVDLYRRLLGETVTRT